jgi:hypothetical protein
MLDRHFLAHLRIFCLLCLLPFVMQVRAQLASEDPDWQESEAPVPPAFNKDKLLPLEMPSYVSLKFGIDPSTLSVTPDGIVRYVVVATNPSGSISAMYEGIRCAKGEVKTYARANETTPWRVVKEPQWRALNDNQPSMHALAFARQGACEGATTKANSAEGIIRAMKK